MWLNEDERKIEALRELTGDLGEISERGKGSHNVVRDERKGGGEGRKRD